MRQVNEPASLPRPETPGGVIPKLEAHIEELRQASRKYGLESDDPFSPVMKALIHVLQWLGALVAELQRISLDHGHQTLQRLQAVRAADEAAASRLKTQMEADETRIVRNFGASIAQAFDEATAGRVRAEVWKIALRAVLVLAASNAAALGLGYQWGRANAEATIHQTERRLEAAFRNGLPGASSWLDLMTWNDIDFSLRQCTDQKLSFRASNGRRACRVPLWIEPDRATPEVVLGEARRNDEPGAGRR
jgi:hypothetical protein